MCKDYDQMGCATFKPMCKLMGNLAHTKCRKTCNLCIQDKAKPKGISILPYLVYFSQYLPKSFRKTKSISIINNELLTSNFHSSAGQSGGLQINTDSKWTHGTNIFDSLHRCRQCSQVWSECGCRC